MRILVVEDEPNLNQLIVRQLNEEHYSVDSCSDGAEAENYINNADYDAIILDLMLPNKNGMDILRDMRNSGNYTPVLILTAKGLLEDRVMGLNLGADDYLAKPFSFDELLARLRAIIRRNHKDNSDKLIVGDLEMDIQTRMVTRKDKIIELSSKEFSVLEYMLRNKGIVLSRDKIEEHIWNYEYEGGSNLVDVYIRFLRKKIDEGFETRLIHTVRGAGYVLRSENEKQILD